MSHFITHECTGCTACAKKCPVEAVRGFAKEEHAIDSSRCIDCGICGNVCPKDAVCNAFGVKVPRLKLSKRPKAEVAEAFCSGCGFCEAVCPVDCIVREEFDFFEVALVEETRCIGCGLCSTVCSKGAISPFVFLSM